MANSILKHKNMPTKSIKFKCTDNEYGTNNLYL